MRAADCRSQPGVGHGVVADEVAGGGDLADERGALADEAADEEEGGVGLMFGEDFEEVRGGFGVGAVVVGEGDLVGFRRGDESGAEELRLGGRGRRRRVHPRLRRGRLRWLKLRATLPALLP